MRKQKDLGPLIFGEIHHGLSMVIAHIKKGHRSLMTHPGCGRRALNRKSWGTQLSAHHVVRSFSQKPPPSLGISQVYRVYIYIYTLW
jgi:hypothetical protein